MIDTKLKAHIISKASTPLTTFGHQMTARQLDKAIIPGHGYNEKSSRALSEGPVKATSAWRWNEYGSDHIETTRRTVVQECDLLICVAAIMHFNLPDKLETRYLGSFLQPHL